jgi:hypothetical protein
VEENVGIVLTDSPCEALDEIVVLFPAKSRRAITEVEGVLPGSETIEEGELQNEGIDRLTRGPRCRCQRRE